jgi:ketosteroid isomerase-like protein
MPLTTEDRLEIAELVARYNHAVDRGDGAAFAATFTDDGVLDAAGRLIEGGQALAAFAEGVPTAFRVPRHVASNLVIDGDGSTGQATLAAYVQMYGLVGDPPRQEILASGTYDDRLAKVAGHWRFVRRVFTRDGEA